MNKIINSYLVLILLSAAIACGGSKKALITQTEIESARSAGTLASLYHKSAKLKLESRGKAKEELAVIQSNIGNLLVSDMSKRVDSRLLGSKTEYGLVDKNILLSLLEKIQPMKAWNEKQFAINSSLISKSLEKTNDAIFEANTRAEQSKTDLVEHLEWKKKIAVLEGKGSDAELSYNNAVEKTITDLLAKGREAYQKRMYNLSLDAAEQGVAIDPGNLQFESLQTQSQTSLFEQEFQFALENGKPEVAYQSLVEISKKPIMVQIKNKMKRKILLLANYFASTAKQSYGSGDLYNAYKNFRRGRDVQHKLGLSAKGFIQEKEFLDLIMNKVDGITGTIGVKYGLLKVIEEFDASYPLLDEKLLTVSQKIGRRATTKLAVSEFREVLSADPVVASVGRRVSSKLEKILFDKLGKKIQIVAAIKSTQAQVQPDSFGEFSGLSLAIHGEVLQAAIESNIRKGHQNKNVQTGVSKLETEEYKKWKKRKRGSAPKQFNESPIVEDVNIPVEHTKKIAVIEVGYRIVEPGTQNVLLTNSITKDSQFNGTSTNEFRKGTFHQEYIEAELPSDIKIMDSLASELSGELGNSLFKYLSSPEEVFYQKYHGAKQKGNPVAGIEMLSNAVVMGNSSEETNEEWLLSLKELVLTIN